MASDTVTAEFRSAQQDLVTLATADLEAFWRTLDTSDTTTTKRQTLSTLPDIVHTYGEIGAALAADFYEELRDSSPYVRRPYTADLPNELVPVAQIQASARWAIGPLWTAADDAALAAETALSQLSGVTSRLALTPARDTVRFNTARDPESAGWRRVGQGETCAFCRMLIGRGNVYSADTAHFGAHDRCDCIAEPAWGGGEPVTAIQYMASKRNPTRADRARVKAFLRGFGWPPPFQPRTGRTNHPHGRTQVMTDAPANASTDANAAKAEDATDGDATPTVESLTAELEALKAHARKHEDRAKANKAAAAELEALKRSTMTDAQKAEADKAATSAALAEAVEKAEKAEAALLRKGIAIDLALSKEDADVLDGISGDEAAIRAVAERLAGRKAAGPKPNATQGRTDNTKASPADAFAAALDDLF